MFPFGCFLFVFFFVLTMFAQRSVREHRDDGVNEDGDSYSEGEDVGERWGMEEGNK